MSIWNDKPELVTELKRLYVDEGLSASRIARELGNNISRNAVIGKVTRLGLPLRGTELPASRLSRQYGKPKPAAPFALPLPAGAGVSASKVRTTPHPEYKDGAAVPPRLEEDGAFVTVLTVKDKDCRYTYGDPSDKDFHFCGHPKTKGCFCENHAPFCFQPQQSQNARRKQDANIA